MIQVKNLLTSITIALNHDVTQMCTLDDSIADDMMR